MTICAIPPTQEQIRAFAVEKFGADAKDALHANIIHSQAESLMPLGVVGSIILARVGNDGPFVICPIPFGAVKSFEP